ncbi:MAG: VWA domain-containing protein [Phycisphaeraceae bacterium]|nr:VWA domain-containing protein [Phycisphaeraceae bacterium]
MTFLAPAAGLTAAAIAVPILLSLYFLKLRRRPVRVSSTLLWRRAVHDLQVNAPFRMIRPSWLLLLQLIALALLLLAFARPAIDAQGGPADRLIICIDRSASMSAADAPGGDGATRLDQAKAEAIELINRHNRSGDATGKSEAIVIAFAHEARALTRFTDNHATLIRAVESIRPTDQAADFPAALRLVRTLITQTGEAERSGTTTIALCSDGSFEPTPEPPSLGAVGAQLRYLQSGPEPGSPSFNVGIVAAGAQRDFEDATLVRVFARLINTGPDPVKVAATLLAEGRPFATKAVDCPPASPGAPGEVGVTFDLRGDETRAPTAIPLRLRLTVDDALASDNNAWMTLAPPTPARVLAVGPAAGGRPDANLLRALEAAAGAVPTPATYAAYEAAPALTNPPQGGFDLIVFDRSTPTAMPAPPTLSFAAGLPIEGLSIGSRDDADAPTQIVWWRRTSPLLRQVALGAVEVYRPRPVTLPGEIEPNNETENDAPAPSSSAWEITTIARGLDGPLMLDLERSGVRRAIVAFAVPESNWSTSISFPIFIANALERLAGAGAGAQARSFTTSDPITLRAAPGAEEIALSLDGETQRAVPVRAGSETAVAAGTLDRVGLYEAQGADADERLLGVNLFNTTESAIATEATVRIAGQDIQRGGVGQAAPREIWPLFVLIAFALLVLEWVLFALRSRV